MVIDHKKDFHRCMPNSLVTIDKGMIEYERKAKGCCFTGDIGVEVLPGKALAWLSQGRFQCAEVPNAACATPPSEH